MQFIYLKKDLMLIDKKSVTAVYAHKDAVNIVLVDGTELEVNYYSFGEIVDLFKKEIELEIL